MNKHPPNSEFKFWFRITINVRNLEQFTQMVFLFDNNTATIQYKTSGKQMMKTNCVSHLNKNKNKDFSFYSWT